MAFFSLILHYLKTKYSPKYCYFLNKEIIIIIHLELYKSPLNILTDILLTLLLAGQYLLVI
jgi:hypothetical protein